jgi:hypothetical protein
MKTLLTITILLVGLSLCRAENRELLMSMNDKYTVSDTEKWTVSVLRQLDLRFADVKVLPRQKKSFSLMLYFKCDTKDLAQFDTPEKMKRSVIESSEKYLGNTVEKEIKVEEIKNKGWYGFKTKLTDASLAGKKTIPEEEFLYIIRGMIRLSEDCALGFSLMTNDPNSAETHEIEKYIYSFAKEKKP